MTIRPTSGYTTCTACKSTHVGGYTLVMGDASLSICEKCIKVLARLLRREEKRIAKA